MSAAAGTPQEYAARVAAKADIADIRLVSTALQVHELPPPGAQLTWALDVGVSVEVPADAPAIIITVRFSLEILPVTDEASSNEETPAPSKIADISTEFAALFVLPDDTRGSDFRPEELQGFASSTAVHALYPYAREMIHDLTGRAGLPPLVINFFRLEIPEPQVLQQP